MYQGALVAMRRNLDCKHLHSLDMVASGGPPDGTRVVHRGLDELLIQQNTIRDGETTSHVQEGSQRSKPLRRFLSHLIDVSTGCAVYQDSPQANGRRRTFGLAPRKAELVGVSGPAYRSWRRASRSSSTQ